MASNDVTSSLLKIAEGLDKLASSIEEDAKAQTEKVAAAPSSMDYGTLGKQTGEGLDPLTAWLLK